MKLHGIWSYILLRSSGIEPMEKNGEFIIRSTEINVEKIIELAEYL